MPRLVLVLRDLYPGPSGAAVLPRLAQLEQWLARGAAEAAPGGWREWLLQTANLPSAAQASPAAVAALAVPGVPCGVPVWLATPVHLVAGLDTVRLHPGGLLELNGEEQRALSQDFAQVFAGSGWALHATGRRELLLSGTAALAAADVRSDDPARWLGADPRAGFPAGRGAEGLRRLGAEIEMWLHSQPLNAARQSRGAARVSALWIWGGGAGRIARDENLAPPGRAAGLAWADDLFVDGLARLQGKTVEPPPQRWPQSVPKAGRAKSEVLAVCALRAAAGEGGLELLERDCIAPAFAQWRSGYWQSATLLAGTCAATLEARRWGSLWLRRRRTRPWWEMMSQC